MMVEVHQVMCCEEETWVSLGLFSNVSNASWLRDEATSGRMLATLLDPSMVCTGKTNFAINFSPPYYHR